LRSLALAAGIADKSPIRRFAGGGRHCVLGWFTFILTCQLAGELFVTVAKLPFPGPVAGMALLFVFLVVRGRIPEDLASTGDALLSNLSLLFVPAGVGIMAHLALLEREWPVLSVALVCSTLATIAVTAGLMVALKRWTGSVQTPPEGSTHE
jgi:holin-like protein